MLVAHIHTSHNSNKHGKHSTKHAPGLLFAAGKDLVGLVDGLELRLRLGLLLVALASLLVCAMGKLGMGECEKDVM